MSIFATLLPLICFLLYPLIVDRIEIRHPTLSSLVSLQRRHWVANASNRDNPLDAILSGNLMGSVSFFASTTVLLILALFAVFGQLPALRAAIGQWQPNLDPFALELHLAVILAIFVIAFLAFTMSLRNFNHFCIMLGALRRDGSASETELDVIAGLNTMGARNFNQGLRAYYFAMASLAWFAAPWLAIVSVVAIIVALVYREFFSPACTLVASLGPK
ncbi:MAG TPA: DUF599 domain-containing protein [Devosiaceae bacterium]|jgi:uncharacterized membrane protein